MPPLGKRTLLVLLYLATRDDAPPLSELANDAPLLAGSLVHVIYPLGIFDDKKFFTVLWRTRLRCLTVVRFARFHRPIHSNVGTLPNENVENSLHRLSALGILIYGLMGLTHGYPLLFTASGIGY
jgi:hypothetical protein